MSNAGDGGNVSLILQAATSDPSNPGPLDFGTQTQGTVGAGQNEFITNNGSAPLRVSSVSLTGTNPDDFIISVDTCTGSSVARFNNCRIAVKFAPQAPAGTAFKVRLTNNDGSPHDVAIYRDAGFSDAIVKGDPFAGPDVTKDLDVPALTAGTYYFNCIIHPADMKGTLVIR